MNSISWRDLIFIVGVFCFLSYPSGRNFNCVFFETAYNHTDGAFDLAQALSQWTNENTTKFWQAYAGILTKDDSLLESLFLTSIEIVENEKDDDRYIYPLDLDSILKSNFLSP